MKAIILTVVLAITSSFSGCLTQSAQENSAADIPSAPVSKGGKRPVLVELFTSEGCSSCPPADKVLMTLQRDQLVPNAEVITLGFHVDYWDRLGWKDRFSSAEFTRRQEAYAAQFGNDSSYTPQIVVDGVSEFVGSNRGRANEEIAKSAMSAKGTIDLKIDKDKLSGIIAGLANKTNATIYLAVAESELSNQVSRGENSGSTLEHASVVRELKQIGTIDCKDAGKTFDVVLPVNPDWKAGNIRYVIFVQENSTLKILAVNQISK